MSREAASVFENLGSDTTTAVRSFLQQATTRGVGGRRKLYPNSSFANLYDETTMPPELRKARQENARAVMKAYGFKPDMSELKIVAKLMGRYGAPLD